MARRTDAPCAICGAPTTKEWVICERCFIEWKVETRELLAFSLHHDSVELDAFESVWRLGGLAAAVRWLDGAGLGFAADLRLSASRTILFQKSSRAYGKHGVYGRVWVCPPAPESQAKEEPVKQEAEELVRESEEGR